VDFHGRMDNPFKVDKRVFMPLVFQFTKSGQWQGVLQVAWARLDNEPRHSERAKYLAGRAGHSLSAPAPSSRAPT
jgi:hypothetical protein